MNGIFGQRIDITDKPGPQWGQVDITHPFLQISIFRYKIDLYLI